MKTVKFVAIDINEIMERVFARTNVVGDGDGSLILGETGSGKTFRMLYEAVQIAWGGDRVLIVEDELDARTVQERLRMVMDYLNVSADDMRKMDIDIMCPMLACDQYETLCDIATESGEYGAVFIDLQTTRCSVLNAQDDSMLGLMDCITYVCKQTNRAAHQR